MTASEIVTCGPKVSPRLIACGRGAAVQVKDFIRESEPGALESALGEQLSRARALLLWQQRQGVPTTAMLVGRIAGAPVATTTTVCETALERCGNIVPALHLALEGLRLWDRYVPQWQESGGERSPATLTRHATVALLECCVEEGQLMQGFVLDFNRLILPETLKAALAGDASVRGVFDELGSVFDDVCSWRRRLTDLEGRSREQREFEASYEVAVREAQRIFDEAVALNAEETEEELGWEEADERAEALEKARARLEAMQQRWSSRASIAQGFTEQRSRREAELKSLQVRPSFSWRERLPSPLSVAPCCHPRCHIVGPQPLTTTIHFVSHLRGRPGSAG